MIIRLVVGLLQWLGIALYHLGLARLVIRWRGPQPRVLLYHACERVESDWIRGLRSNVTPASFARQLDFVERHYAVTPLASLGDAPPPRAAAITFDDGYHSVLTGAAPALRDRGLPYTVFLITRVVGDSRVAWVNAVNWHLHRRPEVAGALAARAAGVAPAARPSRVIDALRERFDPAVIEELLARLGATAVPGPSPGDQPPVHLSWSDVRALMNEGATFGNHTATHPNLAQLPDAAARAEVREAHETIVRELGTCQALAFPFGDLSEAARSEAEVLGYGTICEVTARGGPFDTRALARVPAPDGSPARLFAAVEIVEPFKTMVRRLRGQGRDAASSPA